MHLNDDTMLPLIYYFLVPIVDEENAAPLLKYEPDPEHPGHLILCNADNIQSSNVFNYFRDDTH